MKNTIKQLWTINSDEKIVNAFAHGETVNTYENCNAETPALRIARSIRKIKNVCGTACFQFSDDFSDEVAKKTILTQFVRDFETPKKTRAAKQKNEDGKAIFEYMKKIAADCAPGTPLRGIFFDEEAKMAVATDAHRLIASRLAFDMFPEFHGKIIDFKNGVEIAGKYAKWQTAVPNEATDYLTTFQPLVLDFDTARACVGTVRGLPICFNLKWFRELNRFAPAAWRGSTPFRGIMASDDDLLLLLMPVVIEQADSELLQMLDKWTTEAEDEKTNLLPVPDGHFDIVNKMIADEAATVQYFADLADNAPTEDTTPETPEQNRQSQYNRHAQEATARNFDELPEIGFYYTIHSGLKNGGGGLQQEITDICDTLADEDDRKPAPRLTRIADVIFVSPDEFNDPATPDNLVRQYVEGGIEFAGGARTDDPAPILGDNYLYYYTEAAAVVCPELGKWYAIDAEGYEYARYILLPCNWREMYAENVAEWENEQKRKNEEQQRAIEAEQAAEVAEVEKIEELYNFVSAVYVSDPSSDYGDHEHRTEKKLWREMYGGTLHNLTRSDVRFYRTLSDTAQAEADQMTKNYLPSYDPEKKQWNDNIEATWGEFYKFFEALGIADDMKLYNIGNRISRDDKTGVEVWSFANQSIQYYLQKYYTPQEPEPTPEPTPDALQGGDGCKFDGCEIVRYGEKAVAVIGNTRPYAAQLKAAGGRFNARLTCGAGWIFPASRRAQLTA